MIVEFNYANSEFDLVAYRFPRWGSSAGQKEYGLIYSSDDESNTGKGWYWQELFGGWRTSKSFESELKAKHWMKFSKRIVMK